MTVVILKLMYSDTEAIRIFDSVENTIQQSINLTYFLISSPNQDSYLASSVYKNLSILEEILLYFLYNLPIGINSEFSAKVNYYLVIIYECKINYSRHF